MTTPPTSITTLSYKCPDNSDPLKAGPTTSGQRPRFLVYSYPMDDIDNPLTEDIGPGSQDGLIGNKSIEILKAYTTLVLKPSELLVSTIMSITLKLKNVADSFDFEALNTDNNDIFGKMV